MSYEQTLISAGANVIAYKEFGTYQGDWFAFVEYNGEVGMVTGAFGSCSGCDHFLAALGYLDEDAETEAKYKEFGESYLAGGLEPKEYFERKLEGLKEDDWFDNETREYCEWAIEQFNNYNHA